MPGKRKSGVAAWTDFDDAPDLTDKYFGRADGDRPVRRGRPPPPKPKRVVKRRAGARKSKARNA